MQVEEELVAPACCFWVTKVSVPINIIIIIRGGIGWEGERGQGAEEGLPEGEVLQVPARGLQARAPNLFSRHKYFLLLSHV